MGSLKLKFLSKVDTKNWYSCKDVYPPRNIFVVNNRNIQLKTLFILRP